MEVLIVALLGIGLLIFMALVVGAGLLVFGDLARSYAETLRRLRRNPRFGLRTLLEVVVVLAVTLSILRWLGLGDYRPRGSDWVAVGIVGFIVLVLSVGIVCAVHVLIGDVLDLLRPKKASRRKGQRQSDPWTSADDASARIGPFDEQNDEDRGDEDADT